MRHLLVEIRRRTLKSRSWKSTDPTVQTLKVLVQHNTSSSSDHSLGSTEETPSDLPSTPSCQAQEAAAEVSLEQQECSAHTGPPSSSHCTRALSRQQSDGALSIVSIASSAEKGPSGCMDKPLSVPVIPRPVDLGFAAALAEKLAEHPVMVASQLALRKAKKKGQKRPSGADSEEDADEACQPHQEEVPEGAAGGGARKRTKRKGKASPKDPKETLKDHQGPREASDPMTPKRYEEEIKGLPEDAQPQGKATTKTTQGECATVLHEH